MSKSSRKILIISSRGPEYSAGLGQAIINSLAKAGNEVDYLTLYPSKEINCNILSIKPLSLKDKIKIFLKRFHIDNLLKKIYKRIFKDKKDAPTPYIYNNNILIVYPDESKPDINPSEILNLIKKDYDVVITHFWQDMINTTTLKAIYDKLKCPVLIYSPDMAPMTGGCYYFGNCRNYEHGCGKCPGLNSDSADDQSVNNLALKKRHYQDIECAFLGNTWMNGFAEKSGLFKNIENVEIIIDDTVFTPEDTKKARKKLGIDDKYKFVLLLRSDYAPRKGNKDINEAITKFMQSLTEEQRQSVLVITVGSSYFADLPKYYKFNELDLGKVDINTLILCYQASDFFINASKDDAGPSMVNQSIMCGTPVISYNTGTALDVVIDNESGFKASVGDIDHLSSLLSKGYNLSKEEYAKLSQSTRQIALQHNSPRSFASNIDRIVDSF